MGMWSWAARLAGVKQRVHGFSTGATPIERAFVSLQQQASGVVVGRARALSVPAVQKGRNLLCSIATLPLLQRTATNEVVRSPLLEQINPNCANVVTLALTVEDLVFDAVAWWQVLAFGSDGYPYSARRVDPQLVSLEPPAGKVPPMELLPSGVEARRAGVWISGEFVPAREVIRFDSPNPGVLQACGRAITRAVLFDQAASMYAKDPRPQDYFTPSDGVDPAKDDEIQGILSTWRKLRRTRGTGYVPAGLTYNTVDSPTPAELQLVELQRQVTLELANSLGVDPEDLGVSTTSRTYANAVDRRIDRVNSTLAPYMRAITDRLTMPDVTRRGYHVAFDLTDYMKSNPTERVGYYKAMKDMEAMSAEEIRAAEALPELARPLAPVVPIAGGDTGAGGAGGDATQNARRATHTFNLPTQHHFQFGTAAPHQFAVDTTARTITGLAVPYNKVGTQYGIKYRVRAGALKYAELSRVKHLRDHNTPVGYHLSEQDTAEGKVVTVSVATTPAGDELLSLAQQGVVDGFSVGLEFSLDPADGDVQLGADGVFDVLNARWLETSSTSMPVFDDARMTKVVASLLGGNKMDKCATCGNEHAPGVACPTGTAQPTPPAVTPPGTTPLALAQFAQLQAGHPVTVTPEMLTQLMGVAAAQPVAQPPAQVDPAAQNADGSKVTGTPPAKVTEAQPYRFDRNGNLMRGTHDFSTDILAGYRGDAAALERATKFVRAQFDVNTGNVDELNPVRNRPDLYVDQRSFRNPMWDAINKGTLSDITPFTFPKFSSASGLVGPHTEGVEPSSGTFVVTNQTVTPSAVSGKAKITREAWDQGGNPQLSGLIWRQMVKGWYEALEARAVAVLDAATPTQIALTAGAVDDALVDQLEDAFVALQFVRGGFSMDNLFGQVDLYKALAAAEDTTGRKLLPAIGPSNASGTSQARWRALDINGITAWPAWALAASGTVAASSYLFDSESVHGWASTPQRLDFNIEVANVYIGLWGYAATAISDIAGVREITYDPTA